MYRFTLSLISLTMFFGLFSCRRSQTIYEGNYNDRDLVLKVIEHKRFPASLYEWRLRLGRLPALNLSDWNMDMSEPYDLTLYQKFPHQFIDTTTYRYRNEVFRGVSRVIASMLYVSPDEYTLDEFTQYAACLKDRWKDIEKVAEQGKAPFSPHLVGIVYANRATFIHRFNGLRNGEKYFFEIAADGLIRFRAGDRTSEEGTNLSQLVQMPGRKIYLQKGGPFTKEMLRTYKDESGKTVEDYFDIVVIDQIQP